MKETINQRRKQLVAFLFILLLLVAGWFIYHRYLKAEPEKMTVVSGEFLPEQKDAKKTSTKEMKKLAQSAVDKSKFNLVISPEATISEQTLQGELIIKNPSENGYPINVEIREKKSNQLVYTSGAIEPGYEIKDVTLEQKLEKGEYPSVAMFSLYDPDTKEKKGQVAAGVILTIE